VVLIVNKLRIFRVKHYALYSLEISLDKKNPFNAHARVRNTTHDLNVNRIIKFKCVRCEEFGSLLRMESPCIRGQSAITGIIFLCLYMCTIHYKLHFCGINYKNIEKFD